LAAAAGEKGLPLFPEAAAFALSISSPYAIGAGAAFLARRLDLRFFVAFFAFLAALRLPPLRFAALRFAFLAALRFVPLRFVAFRFALRFAVLRAAPFAAARRTTRFFAARFFAGFLFFLAVIGM